MTRKKWTSKEQEAWLKARCKAFAEAEINDTTKAFYQDTLDRWLEVWPNPEPTPAEIQAAGGLESAVKAKAKWQDNVSAGCQCLHHVDNLNSHAFDIAS